VNVVESNDGYVRHHRGSVGSQYQPKTRAAVAGLPRIGSPAER
jgi:hypothetical protein